MASDFSISALLGLPDSREQFQVSEEKDNGSKEQSCGVGLSGMNHSLCDGKRNATTLSASSILNVNVSTETSNNTMGMTISPSSSILTANYPTKLSNESSSLESRLSPEFTTIVIPNKDAKPRRKRTAFSNIQLYFLEEFFQKKAYPSSHERNFIASILSIGSGQVKTWFQNRRTKWKKSNFADFEKQAFLDTSCQTVSPLWSSVTNQVVWCPSFSRPTVMSSHFNSSVSLT